MSLPQGQQMHGGVGSGGSARKLDRVFTQSSSGKYDQSGSSLRYGTNNRRQPMMSGSSGRDHYMGSGMVGGPSGTGVTGPMNNYSHHFRTVSGSGTLDDYDYGHPMAQAHRYNRPAPPPRRSRGYRTSGMRDSMDHPMPRYSNGGDGYYGNVRRATRNMYENIPPPPRIHQRNRYNRNSVGQRSRGISNDEMVPSQSQLQQQPKPQMGVRRRRATAIRTRTQQQANIMENHQHEGQSVRGSSRDLGNNQNNSTPSGTNNKRRNGSRSRRQRRRSNNNGNNGNNGNNDNNGNNGNVNRNQQRQRYDSQSGETSQQTQQQQGRTKSVRRFSCSICKRTFRSDSLRVRHIRLNHTRRRDFVCRQCRLVFPTAHSLTVHLSQPHTENPSDLLKASSSAGNGPNGRRRPPLGLPIRMLSADIKLFDCQYCPFSFLNANDVESHQSRCRASQRIDFKITIEYPGNENYALYCMCCPELLSLRQGIKEHFDNLHAFVNLEVTYRCALCTSEFSDEIKAKEHFKQEHASADLTQLYLDRQKTFASDSLKSYQPRPVSLIRTKAEIRSLMSRMLRQVCSMMGNGGNQAPGRGKGNKGNVVKEQQPAAGGKAVAIAALAPGK